MVRIDMGEYMEKHSVSRLIGAPPGYVGYDEGGQLTEAVRRRPYCVVLLDEIEKAHPDVFNVLLQVLDDGRLTDGQGRTVDFTNVVLIMTSQPARAIRSSFFKPEFINRVDDIIRFRSLTEDDLAPHRRDPARPAARAARRRGGSRSTVTPTAMALLAHEGFDPAFGARPLKRVIQREIGDPAAVLLLEGKVDRRRHDHRRRRRRPARRHRRLSRGAQPAFRRRSGGGGHDGPAKSTSAVVDRRRPCGPVRPGTTSTGWCGRSPARAAARPTR